MKAAWQVITKHGGQIKMSQEQFYIGEQAKTGMANFKNLVD